MNTFWCFLALIGSVGTIHAQVASSAWIFKSNEPFNSNEKLLSGEMPNIFKTAVLDMTELTSQLAQAPKSGSNVSSKNGLEIELPNPDGELTTYIVFENNVIAPEVAHLYTIKTYKGYAKKDRDIHIRFSVKESGFYANVFAGHQTYVIENRKEMNRSSYLVYFQRDFPTKPLDCNYDHTLDINTKKYDSSLKEEKSPTALRTLRLAMASAGEFSQQFGGSPYSATTVLNEMANGVNMINEIYEKDFGITFMLVSDASIVFPDPTTDPFNTSDIMLDNIHNTIDANIGTNNFDIGHLIAWVGEGGVAWSDACQFWKGGGFSPSNISLFELFIGFCTHEMGHQLGADHTFADDDCENSVDGFRYEVGRGSSIMGYSDVGCGAGYTLVLDPFFHSESIVQMENYIQANGCHTNSDAGLNASAPVANANSNITIPAETAFVLVGSATDGNDASSQLTYSWEQGDGSGPATVGNPDCNSTIDPLFRFRPPMSENYRVMPELDEVLLGNNYDVVFEQLPCVARTLNFNLLVRDNNVDWGRTNMDEMVVTVANTGPFYVDSPDGGETWTNSTNTVLWEEMGTSAHCPNVDIILSEDGGATFSVVAVGVPNDGSHDITLSGINTTTARILVQCSVGGNFASASTFFDVSDGDFTINISGTTTGANWIGVADTDWQNPANWAGGIVPDMNSDVIIPAGVPFYPVIDENVTINTIDVQQGATIDIPDDFCFFVIAQ